MEKYEIYRDSVDSLPSCQLEVQLYQKKIQELADNREKLTNILKEVCIVGKLYVFVMSLFTIFPWICFYFLLLIP